MTGRDGHTLLVFSALLSHWRRHKIQVATLFVGLMAATALWSAVQAINSHARNSYDRAAAAVEKAPRAAFDAVGGGPFDEAAFAALRRAGVPVTPVIAGTLGTGIARISFTGIDPLTYGGTSGEGFDPPEGSDVVRFLGEQGVLFAAPSSVATVESLLADIPALERPLVEASAGIADGSAIADIAVVQRLLGQTGLVSRLMLPAGDATRAADLPPPWNARLVRAEPAVSIDIAALSESFHLNLTAFGMLSCLVGLFIVYAAISLAVESRMPSIRMLRICGASNRRILQLLVLEMTLIAALAGGTGVVLGYLIAGALLPDVALSLRGLFGARISGALALEPSWWLGGLLISLVGALAAAAASFLKVAQMPLLAWKGGGTWHRAQVRGLKIRGSLGILAFIVAALCYSLGAGLTAAFAVMAGLLVGAALLLPAVLAGALVLAANLARRPVPRWFWAESRLELGGLSLALMALLLALGANIGVGTMVEGFRKTFDAFLDERLAAELYLFAPDNRTGDTISAWLENQDSVAAILPYPGTRSAVGGIPVNLTGFKDHSTFRDGWTFLDAGSDPWGAAANGDAALVNEQFARKRGLWVGDILTLDTPAGPYVIPIAGVYADYGNPMGEVRLSAGKLLALWPQADRQRIGVRVRGDVAELVQAITAEFGLSEGRMVDQTQLKAYSKGIFEKTFAISSALNTLTLGIAGVALLTSLLTLASARITGVAPVWAMGMPTRQIAGLELMRVMVLALLTALVAVPLGIAVAWCLVAVINVEAFGWRLPLYLFPRQWLDMIAVGCLTALVAAAYPALKLMRTSPSRLAKVFAYER